MTIESDASRPVDALDPDLRARDELRIQVTLTGVTVAILFLAAVLGLLMLGPN